MDGTDDHLFPSANAAKARHADWSPDGNWLVYRVDGPADTDTIWISRVDGAEARQLVDCDSPCLFVDDPAWSPDGTRIAFWRDGGDEGQAIRVVDVASGAVTSVISGSPGEGPAQPRWAPAGDRLVIEIELHDTSGNVTGNRLGLIDLAAEIPTFEYLTPPELSADYPDWSSFADTILFEAGDGDPFSLEGEPLQLFTIRPDGSGLVQLTTRSASEGLLALPAWAAGGNAILLTLIHSRDNFTLARADSDGSHVTEILGDDGQPIVGAHTRAAGQ
jgi:dipeptidyl aminopeptidase/acylaminoacyl peptidase